MRQHWIDTARLVLALVPFLALGPPAVADEAGSDLPIAVTRIEILGLDGKDTLLDGPLSIALDERDDLLFVSCSTRAEVVVMDTSGRLLRRIGANEGLISPFGVAVDGAGSLYVSESSTGRIKVFDLRGELVADHDLSASIGHRVSPGRLSLGPRGELFVIDMANDELLVFDAQIRVLGVVEGLTRAQKGAALRDGNWVVTAAEGAGVRRFAPDATLLSEWGHHGDAQPDRVSFPSGFAEDALGRIWIADAFQHRIHVLSPEDELLMDFGRMDDGGGEWGFLLPVDLCVGAQGPLYVLEKGANRIQVFDLPDLREGEHE
jgi:hypothetical protein